MILVSACLAGINCKYSAGNNYRKEIASLVREGKALPVCPEQLGGLTTPRIPAEIVGGNGADLLAGRCKVQTRNGDDISAAFIHGAEETLAIAKLCNADRAILKSRSPSCGCGHIYDGSFSGTLRSGNGVTAELLIRNGISVSTEDDWHNTPD